MTIASRSPRSDVVHRLRQLERLSLAYARRSEHGYFRALAHLLGALAVSLEVSPEPTERLFAIAAVSRRSAEAPGAAALAVAGRNHRRDREGR